MSETPESGDQFPYQDDTAKYLRKLLNGLRPLEEMASDVQDEELRADAQKIRDNVPGAAGTLHIEDENDITGVAQTVLDRFLAASVLDTVANNYQVFSSPPSRPEHSFVVGIPPAERTPISRLQDIAGDEELARMDERLQAMGMMSFASPEDVARRRSLAQATIAEILHRYGVPPEAITPGDASEGALFSYKGSRVHIAVGTDGGIEIMAWSDQLSPEEEERVVDEYGLLIRQGAPLQELNRLLSAGKKLPPYLQKAEGRIRAEHEDIEAALHEQEQRLRTYCNAYGIRRFYVSGAGFRLVIPPALHLLERSIEETYPIIGAHSQTSGAIRVRQAGSFVGWNDPDVIWDFTADGDIEQRS
jgi:hypothetical protein